MYKIHFTNKIYHVLSFMQTFPDAVGRTSKVMYDGGHVTKNHGKKLEKMAAIKTFTINAIQKHKGEDLLSLKCHCIGKKHSQGCGCLTNDFIRNAR